MTTQLITCKDNPTFNMQKQLAPSPITIQTFAPAFPLLSEFLVGRKRLGYCLEIIISETMSNDNDCYGRFG